MQTSMMVSTVSLFFIASSGYCKSMFNDGGNSGAGGKSVSTDSVNERIAELCRRSVSLSEIMLLPM